MIEMMQADDGIIYQVQEEGREENIGAFNKISVEQFRISNGTLF